MTEETEAVPFEVNEETLVGDLSDVKEIRQIVPIAQGVKFRIANAKVITDQKRGSVELPTLKSLGLELRIVDGIPVQDPDSNEVEMKYKNKPLFTGLMDLCFWADPEVKTSQWYKNRQHLVGFKKFLQALGFELAGVRVNDAFLSMLKDLEIAADIRHREETAWDETKGEYIAIGTYKEQLVNWRKAE